MQYSPGDLYGADYYQFCGIWRDMECDGRGRNRRLSRRIREPWQPGADAFHVFQSAVCGDACAVDSGYYKNQQSEIQDHRSGVVCDFLKTGLLHLESSFSIMGVGIGAFFRLKNKEQKALALSYGITAIVAGTSEPTIYGICTKYKKPFIGLLAGGFIGGAYAGLTGVIDATLVPSSNVFAALCFLGKSQANVVNGIIACVIAFVSTALLVYFFGFDKNEKDIQA